MLENIISEVKEELNQDQSYKNFRTELTKLRKKLAIVISMRFECKICGDCCRNLRGALPYLETP